MHLLLPIGFTLTPLIGWLTGAPWLTVLIAVVVLPMAEWCYGRSAAPLQYQWGFALPRAIMMAAIAVPLGFAAHADQLAWGEVLWLSLGCGYVSGGIGIVLAHELGHRRARLDRLLARTLLTSIGYGHYLLEHNQGHHRHAATLPDPATARAHESLWQFMPRYFYGVFSDSLRLSRQQRGRLNEALCLSLLSAVWGLCIFGFAGWKGITFWLMQSLMALMLVAAIDYVEHWGLQRHELNGRYERLGPPHIWDCANRLSDALLFNLPRHSSHHLEPSLNSDALYHVPESPQMPTGYAGMTLLASVPPLFRKIMTPRLPTERQASAPTPENKDKLAWTPKH